MTITITPVTGTELHRRYTSQSRAQDAYIELDCATGALGAESNCEIGNAVPFRVWHGHIQRWSIPAMKADAANALLKEIAPLAEGICHGYRSEWDGNNHVARFAAGAESCLEAVEALCERAHEDAMAPDVSLNVWDAADWLGGVGSYDAQCRSVGITADTTDAELEMIGETIVAEAESDGVDKLDRLDRHLETLRAHAIEERAGDEADKAVFG